MKSIVAFAFGITACAGFARGTDEKKPEVSIEGKYTLVSGKKFGAGVDDAAKKAEYTIDKDTVTIKGNDAKFVMKYALTAGTSPMQIDMEIVEGPEGTKGSKARGIVAVKGDELKLAYSLEKDKRPKDFDGKEGLVFVFQKAK